MIKQSFKIDEIVICLEEVKLLLNDNTNLKNYIAVSTVKLDSQMIEEGFYNSFLYIYEIEPQERRLKLSRLE